MLSTDWLLPPSVWLPLLSSASPPLTLALADASLSEIVLAENVTASLAERLRAVVASAWSLTTATATEMPTPVLLDSVSPSALVSTLSVREALSVSSPVIVSRPPLPIVA